MIRGLIFHTLRGINGWSNLSYQKIDISRVLHLESVKRSLKIRDRDYDYTLKIIYEDANPESTGNPGINLGDHKENPLYYSVNNQTITKRYKTEQDVMEEIGKIKYKQELLKNYCDRIVGDIVVSNIKKM